ncbi:MAG: O-antigen polymerase [Vibrio litoralis]|uniref:O-antigen polymerase n=1 Tax=Vibrio litoralis TaxID=335972 RepID=UPI003F985F48
MMINQKPVLVAFISVFSWFLLSSGIIYFKLGYVTALVTIVTLCFLFVVVYKVTNTLDLDKDFYFESKILWWILFISLLAYTMSIIDILIEYNFNLQYVRNTIFKEDVRKEIFGNIFISMFFTYVIKGLFYGYIFSVGKFKRHHYILIATYVISGIIVGGRFNLYHAFIFIILVNLLYPSVKNFKIVNRYSIISFFLAIFVSFNRFMLANDTSFVDAISRVAVSIYNYHAVQFGVYLLFSEHNNVFSGIFTGLLTPFFVISGQNSIEGYVGYTLDKVEFLEKGYNAFGTSGAYFSVFGDLGLIVFILTVLLNFIFIGRCVESTLRKKLVIYSVFSMYFSAFSPFYFTFTWWVGFILILCFHRFNKVVFRKD